LRNIQVDSAMSIREHFRGPLRIDQLAKMAGMGVSMLHRHFHELKDMSPIQYQKRLRLHEARRLMLEESYKVGTAALDVGYETSTQSFGSIVGSSAKLRSGT
jgi:AraC-like DNA-binding protein